MKSSLTTHWSLIDAAANGGAAERDEFARLYTGPARAWLGARWRSTRFLIHLDDAVQEVCVQCFREGGALDKADRERGRFRDFYLGVVRNVAARFERRDAIEHKNLGERRDELPDVVSDDASVAEAFDQSWAKCLVQQAVERQEAVAAQRGDEAALRRVELLRMRFEDGLPVREIARVWNVDPDDVHYQYRVARKEFKATLLELITLHNPGSKSAVASELELLQDLLA